MPALLWVALLLLAPAVQCLKLKGLAYSPYADSTNQFCLPFANITQDLTIVARLTSRIRIFGISACPDATRQILSYAQARGMSVFMGLSVTLDTAANEKELQFLPSLLLEYGNSGVINAIAVGNEAMTSEGVTLDYLIWYLRRVRSRVSQRWTIPVTVVETASKWDNVQSPSSVAFRLAPEVDFAGANIQPYLEGLPASCNDVSVPGCFDAPTWTVKRAQYLQASLGMPLVLTETGWPSQGELSSNLIPWGFPPNSPLFMAVPSITNSRSMLNRFFDLAQQAGIDYYYFEAFDASWKRVYAPCHNCQHLSGCINGFCTYSYNFGLCGSNRQSKPGLGVACGDNLPPAPPSPPLPPHPHPHRHHPHLHHPHLHRPLSSPARPPLPPSPPWWSSSPPPFPPSPSPSPSPPSPSSPRDSPPPPSPRDPPTPPSPRDSPPPPSPSPRPPAPPSPRVRPSAPPPSPPPAHPPMPPGGECSFTTPCPTNRPYWYCYGTGDAYNGCRDMFWGPFSDTDCSAQCSTAPSPPPPSMIPPPPSNPDPSSPSAPPPAGSPPPSPRPPSPPGAKPPSPPPCSGCAHRPPSPPPPSPPPVKAPSPPPSPPPASPPSPPPPVFPLCVTSPCPGMATYFYCSGYGLAKDGCQEISQGPWPADWCSAQCITSISLSGGTQVVQGLGQGTARGSSTSDAASGSSSHLQQGSAASQLGAGVHMLMWSLAVALLMCYYLA